MKRREKEDREWVKENKEKEKKRKVRKGEERSNKMERQPVE